MRGTLRRTGGIVNAIGRRVPAISVRQGGGEPAERRSWAKEGQRAGRRDTEGVGEAVAHVLLLLRPWFGNLREQRVRDKPKAPADAAGAFGNSIPYPRDRPLVSQRLSPPSGAGRMADYSARVKVMVKVFDFSGLAGPKRCCTASFSVGGLDISTISTRTVVASPQFFQAAVPGVLESRTACIRATVRRSPLRCTSSAAHSRCRGREAR